MGFLRFDDAIVSEKGIFGALTVAYQARPCSWLSGPEDIQAEESFMHATEANEHSLSHLQIVMSPEITTSQHSIFRRSRLWTSHRIPAQWFTLHHRVRAVT